MPRVPIRLSPILLFVNRFDLCLEFYQKAIGLKLTRVYRGRKHPHYAEFQAGNLRFALHGGHKGPPLRICEPLAMHFEVRNIRDILGRVKKYKGRVKRPVRKIDFRPAELEIVYAATVSDPDGNEFDLHQVLRRFHLPL